MTQRISSPEELNSRMKVNGAGVWIVLIALIAAVIVGMVLFLSNEIVMHESHPCYVSDVSMPSIDALYETVFTAPVYSGTVTRDDVETVYGDLLKPHPYSQLSYFLIDDPDHTEMAEGMTFYIGDNAGFVISFPNEPTEYEDMLRLGIREKEMRKAGLTPGLPYYMITALLFSDRPDPVLTPGFYTADVILDTVDPVSFILKQEVHHEKRSR